MYTQKGEDILKEVHQSVVKETRRVLPDGYEESDEETEVNIFLGVVLRSIMDTIMREAITVMPEPEIQQTIMLEEMKIPVIPGIMDLAKVIHHRI